MEAIRCAALNQQRGNAVPGEKKGGREANQATAHDQHLCGFIAGASSLIGM